MARYIPWAAGVLFAGASSAGLMLAEAREPLLASISDGDGKKGRSILAEKVPTRSQMLSKLRGSDRDSPFDLLVIGGGATGSGSAVDAVTRGLTTVLVEREDFGSGTSSKSTKLVHGGVRYLEKAVFQMDPAQLNLVFEALHERKAFLDNCSHLARPVPIIMPCYKWWEIPFMWVGLKAYDLLAGTQALIFSKYLGVTETINMLPMLAPVSESGHKLKGSILYYDGQFDDARVNVTLACTAAAAGAVVANYTECRQLLKNEDGKVVGAKMTDRMTGEDIDVYAKVVVNAAGPFADKVRATGTEADKLDACVMGASGVHITLPDYFCSGGYASAGLIIPKTKDGRVVFMLPWLGQVIAGTTDDKCDITYRIAPTQKEVDFILETLSDHLSVDVKRSDVKSAWSGIRPLAFNPKTSKKEGGTQNVVRDHLIFEDDDGMITITGGKWTTYRRMAQDVIDTAVATGRLPATKPCTTASFKLLGGERNQPHLPTEVAQHYHVSSTNGLKMSTDTATHLSRSYGDRVGQVVKIADSQQLGTKLVEGYPHIEAEVVYCAQNEYCEKVEDFLARRSRLAFLDVSAANDAIPRVADLMASTLSWSEERKQSEIVSAQEYMKTFMSLS